MTDPTPHPLEKASAEELRVAARKLCAWANEMKGLIDAAPEPTLVTELGRAQMATADAHGDTLFLRADLADLRAEIREMTNNPNPRG